ncbi:DUF6440 family protein [Companilactobacillus ginsenosidimutans]|uniref:DUF6440 family protein n=1 Tax=Companilactobacillus ginsenosidimutans TaxID=1007676 RepID=UPI000B06F3AA|nr:DUF6440 family protein [Companilactobacillus ginsenosidimutans]
MKREKFVKLTSSSYITIFVDPETGVEYAMNSAINGDVVSPLYNADGSLKVNEEYRKK